MKFSLNDLKDRKITLVPLTVLVLVLFVYVSRGREVQSLQIQLAALKKETALPTGRSDVKAPKVAGPHPTLTLSEFIENATQWAGDDSVQVREVKLGGAQANGDFAEQAVQLEVQGRFQDIGEYLRRMEEAQWPLKIVVLRLEGSEALSPEILASLDLLVYLRKTT